MTATMSTHPDHISVRIEGTFGYAIWQTVRAARDAADDAALPLWLDLERCHGFELGGVGAVLLAQERLKSVHLHGCREEIRSLLAACGICRLCAAAGEAACANRSAAGAE